MATTAEGAVLTEAHRLAQAQLAAEMTAQMQLAWPLLDLEALDTTTARWLAVARFITDSARATSADLSVQYLRLFRALETGDFSTTFTPIPAGPAAPAMLATSLIVTGPIKVKQVIGAGDPLTLAATTGRASSAAAAMRQALNGGRDTIRSTGATDQHLVGYQRVTSGRPCYFCAMLASRGPVYRTEDSGGFLCHDGCSCTDEPVYDRSAPWLALNQQYADLWRQSTRGLAPGDTPVRAFRRAFEAQA